MKTTIVGIFTFLLVASSGEYILPYPSLMPGHKLYKAKEIWDGFRSYFMWGNFTRFTFELKQADKNLVEAKTMFEYGQTEFGRQALEKYRTHISKLPKLLVDAKKEGKNTSEKEALLKSALDKHQKVLKQLE